MEQIMSIKTEETSNDIKDGVYGPKGLEELAGHGCYVSPDKLTDVFDDPDDIDYVDEDVYDVYEVDDSEDFRDRVTDRLMNCDCEEQVEVVDSYIVIDEDSKEPMLNTIFMCAGCGNQVRVEALVCGIYDIDIYGTKRE